MVNGLSFYHWLICNVYRLEEARQALAEAREKIDHQNQQLSDYEAEIGLLRRRVEQLESDRDKDKKLIHQLQETLNRTRAVRGLILPFINNTHRCIVMAYGRINAWKGKFPLAICAVILDFHYGKINTHVKFLDFHVFMRLRWLI